MKKIFIGSMIITLIIMLATSVYASEIIGSGACGKGLTWTLDSDGALTISGEGDMWDYIYPPDMPWYQKDVRSVMIKEGVKSIGSYTLSWVIGDNVSNISIPSSVTEISKTALYRTSAEEIKVAEANQDYSSIDGVLFNKAKDTLIQYPTGKENVDYVVPESVKKISEYAFSNAKLDSITLSSGLTNIAKNAFDECKALSVHYDGTIVDWGKISISEGNDILKNNLPYMDSKAQGKLTDTISWEISDDMTLIISGNGDMPNDINNYESPWYSARNYIKKIIINEGITSVATNIFSSLSKITTIEFPSSVTSISQKYSNYSLFNGCSSLEEIIVDSGNEQYFSDNGVLYKKYTGGNVPESYKNKSSLQCIPNAMKGTYEMPEYVEFADSRAFYECINIENITVSNNNPAFCAMNGVLYDKNVTRIYTAAKGISGEYHMPDTVSTIDSYAFKWCDKLETLYISDMVYRIPEEAFSNCNRLSEVHFSNRIISVPGSAFTNCSMLSDIYYGGTETEWENLNINKPNLTIYYNQYEVIPSGEYNDSISWSLDDEGTLTVSGIGVINNFTYNGVGIMTPWYTFKNEIKNVIIEDGITIMGGGLFSRCYSLQSITVPYTVLSMDMSIIECPDNLTMIGYSGSVAEEFAIENNFAFETIGEMPDADVVSGQCGDDLTWAIDTYKTLKIDGTGEMWDFGSDGEYAPWYEEYRDLIKKIEVNGASSIGKLAFLDCSNAEEVSLAEGLIEINADAFNQCRALKEINIPQGVTAINQQAFYLCTNLETLNIPASVNFIGEGVFADCDSLKGCTIDPDNVYYKMVDNILFDYDEKTLVRYFPVNDNTTYTIPEGVERLSGGAFSDVSQLTEIIVPESVTYMGYSVFYGCNNLKEINLPPHITEIPYNAFCYCNNLEKVQIPDSITDIGNWAFAWCSKMKSIYIPKGVKGIEYACFYMAYGLRDVYYGGDRSDWEAADGFVDHLEKQNSRLTIHYNSTGANPPEIIGEPDVDVIDNVYTVDVKLQNVEYDSNIITVTYDNGAATGFDMDTISAGDTEKSISVKANSANVVKVFIWDSLEGMHPLCEPKEIILNEVEGSV